MIVTDWMVTVRLGIAVVLGGVVRMRRVIVRLALLTMVVFLTAVVSEAGSWPFFKGVVPTIFLPSKPLSAI